MTDGKTIGVYEIKGQIGRGGMATVLLARDPRFNRQVALKLLPRKLAGDAMFRARFEREAHTVAALEHPGIVPVYDFGEHEGQPYLVMRYMPGGSLAERIKEGPLSLQEVEEVVRRIAPALDAAHRQGLIHRDLKPANILFDRWDKPYLSDFGIVKVAEGQALTMTGGVIGTVDYMSPEQAQGEEGLDYRSDIYSLAVTVFGALSGKPPYRASTPVGVLTKHVTAPIPALHEVRPEISPAVSAVVARGMAKDPADRYPSAGAFAEAFSAAIAGNAPVAGTRTRQAADERTIVDATPGALPAEGHNHRGRLPWLILGAVVIVAGIAAGAILTPRLLTPDGEDAADLAPAANGGELIAEAPADETSTATVEAPTATATATASPTATATGTPAATASATPGLQRGSTRLSNVDGMTMVYIPEGPFLMGSVASDSLADPDEMPQREILLDAFWIDRTEVSIAQYRLCMDAGACLPPQRTDAQTYDDYFGNPAYDNYPVVWVTWEAADRYCRWTGRRLPTEAEWEKAARGTDGSQFPWGDARPSGTTANTCDVNCPYGWADANINDGYSGSGPVDAFTAGASPYGALNMAGNVWEWTATLYDAGYYQAMPAENPPGPASGDTYIARGGSWQNPWEFVRPASRNRETQFPENLYHVGFRCAQTAS